MFLIHSPQGYIDTSISPDPTTSSPITTFATSPMLSLETESSCSRSHLSPRSSVLLLLLLLNLLLILLLLVLLLLRRNLGVELHVVLVVVVLLEILDRLLPDTSKRRSRVLCNSRPSGPGTEQLNALCLGGKRIVKHTSSTCDTVELPNVLECVVTQDVLSDERAAIKDHDGLCLAGAAVRNDGALSEDFLLDLVAAAVVDGDLNLLYDKHDGGDVAELVLHVGLAEQVVQVVVEAVVDLVDDEDLVDLLHDLLLAAVVVDDLKVLLLDLDDLLLLVEVVEAVGEVETVTGEAVEHCAVEAIAEDVVTLRDGGSNGAGGCEVLLVLVMMWRNEERTYQRDQSQGRE
jgi:hypothetical protein